MTTFTATLPTEPGWYYFASNKVDQFTPVEVYSDFFGSLRSRGRDTRGGLWGGRVPAPGTTWNVEQIKTWMDDFDKPEIRIKHPTKYNNPQALIDDPQSGIAATTARHRKEQV